MKNMYLAKLASGAAITAMVLTSAGTMAFAQTTGGTGGTGTTVTGTTGAGSTTTTGTTGAGTTGTGSSTTGSGTTSIGGTSTTPGTPNTGAGGDATTNLALLGISALALIGGGAYLARQRFTR